MSPRGRAAAAATGVPACGRGSAGTPPSRRRTHRARHRPGAICGRGRNRAGRSRCRAAIVGVHAGIPFAALHQHRRVRDQRVAADMVEMEMRVDDEVDLRRDRGRSLRAGRRSPRRGDSRTRTAPASRAPSRPAGSCWQSGCMPVSNSAVPFGCSIRKAGIGSRDAALAALHQPAEIALQPAAGQRINIAGRMKRHLPDSRRALG